MRKRSITPKQWKVLALSSVFVLGLAACEGGLEQEGGVVEDLEEATGATSLDVTLADYGFEMPDEVDGGVVELTATNEDDVPHEVGFMKVPEDYDVDDFPDDMDSALQGEAIPEEFQNASGITDVPAGESVTRTITLPEGNYVVFCSLTDEVAEEDTAPEEEGISSTEGLEEEEGQEDDDDDGDGAEDDDAQDGAQSDGGDDDAQGDDGDDDAEDDGPQPHYQLGMTKQVTVTGGADVSGADITGTDGTLEASDYSFETGELADLGEGEHTMTFHNTSEEQFHHAVVLEFPEGIDEEEAQDAFEAIAEAGEGPPPEGVPEPEDAGYTAVFGPDMGGTFDVTLQSGRTYAVACFIQDRDGGPPHAFAHDMFEIFTLE